MAPAFLEACYGISILALFFYFLATSLGKGREHWFWFGFLYSLIGLSWLFAPYPISWLAPGYIQLIGIGSLVILLSTISGISYLLIHPVISRAQPSWMGAILFSFAVFVAEVLRSFLFSLFLSGNGGSIGLHYNAGTLGNALSFTPLVEYAYIGGTYALAFVASFIIYTLVHRENLKHTYMGGCIVLVGLLCIHVGVPVQEGAQNMRVAVITTDNINPTDETNLAEWFKPKHKNLVEKVRSLAATPPDIIVFPEDARFISHLEQETLDELQSSFPTTVFIDGDTKQQREEYVNMSILYTPEQANLASGRGKVFILPFNEYVPKLLEYIILPFVGKEGIAWYAKNHTYTPFSTMEAFNVKGTKVGTLICSEAASFDTINLLKQDLPSLVFLQSNLSVFNENPWFFAHYQSYAKVAAAQLRVPVVVVSNRGPSFVISSHGNALFTLRENVSLLQYKTSGAIVDSW